MNGQPAFSEPKPLPVRAQPVWFRPPSFLAGLVCGLAALSALGFWLGQRNSHPGFTRLIPAVSPETFYYPTVAELSSIVRARCRPDQILVIIGGNSILYGSGQPTDQLWSRRLQELLGARFCVVNLAFRGGSASDGASVVAEALRQEFPRQILVANTGTVQGTSPIGSGPFRFLFWEAYYKGELEDYAPRNVYVKMELDAHDGRDSAWLDTAGRVWLDRELHFRDLWNWIAMRWCFTIPDAYYPTWREQFQPRMRFQDEEGNFDDTPFVDRFPADTLALETQITRGFTETHYERTADGGWMMRPAKRAEIDAVIRATMPEPLRRRTLIIVSKNSPFYVGHLTPEEQRRDAQSFDDTIALYRAAGYSAMTYPDDLTQDDYGDRAHLTVSGGRKLADAVAVQVRAIAGEQGYLSTVHR